MEKITVLILVCFMLLVFALIILTSLFNAFLRFFKQKEAFGSSPKEQEAPKENEKKCSLDSGEEKKAEEAAENFRPKKQIERYCYKKNGKFYWKAKSQKKPKKTANFDKYMALLDPENFKDLDEK